MSRSVYRQMMKRFGSALTSSFSGAAHPLLVRSEASLINGFAYAMHVTPMRFVSTGIERDDDVAPAVSQTTSEVKARIRRRSSKSSLNKHDDKSVAHVKPKKKLRTKSSISRLSVQQASVQPPQDALLTELSAVISAWLHKHPDPVRAALASSRDASSYSFCVSLRSEELTEPIPRSTLHVTVSRTEAPLPKDPVDVEVNDEIDDDFGVDSSAPNTSCEMATNDGSSTRALTRFTRRQRQHSGAGLSPSSMAVLDDVDHWLVSTEGGVFALERSFTHAGGVHTAFVTLRRRAEADTQGCEWFGEGAGVAADEACWDAVIMAFQASPLAARMPPALAAIALRSPTKLNINISQQPVEDLRRQFRLSRAGVLWQALTNELTHIHSPHPRFALHPGERYGLTLVVCDQKGSIVAPPQGQDEKESALVVDCPVVLKLVAHPRELEHGKDDVILASSSLIMPSEFATVGRVYLELLAAGLRAVSAAAADSVDVAIQASPCCLSWKARRKPKLAVVTGMRFYFGSERCLSVAYRPRSSDSEIQQCELLLSLPVSFSDMTSQECNRLEQHVAPVARRDVDGEVVTFAKPGDALAATCFQFVVAAASHPKPKEARNEAFKQLLSPVLVDASSNPVVAASSAALWAFPLEFHAQLQDERRFVENSVKHRAVRMRPQMQEGVVPQLTWLLEEQGLELQIQSAMLSGVIGDLMSHVWEVKLLTRAVAAANAAVQDDPSRSPWQCVYTLVDSKRYRAEQKACAQYAVQQFPKERAAFERLWKACLQPGDVSEESRVLYKAAAGAVATEQPPVASIGNSISPDVTPVASEFASLLPGFPYDMVHTRTTPSVLSLLRRSLNEAAQSEPVVTLLSKLRTEPVAADSVSVKEVLREETSTGENKKPQWSIDLRLVVAGTDCSVQLAESIPCALPSQAVMAAYLQWLTERKEGATHDDLLMSELRSSVFAILTEVCAFCNMPPPVRSAIIDGSPTLVEMSSTEKAQLTSWSAEAPLDSLAAAMMRWYGLRLSLELVSGDDMPFGAGTEPDERVSVRISAYAPSAGRDSAILVATGYGQTTASAGARACQSAFAQYFAFASATEPLTRTAVDVPQQQGVADASVCEPFTALDLYLPFSSSGSVASLISSCVQNAIDSVIAQYCGPQYSGQLRFGLQLRSSTHHDHSIADQGAYAAFFECTVRQEGHDAEGPAVVRGSVALDSSRDHWHDNPFAALQSLWEALCGGTGSGIVLQDATNSTEGKGTTLRLLNTLQQHVVGSTEFQLQVRSIRKSFEIPVIFQQTTPLSVFETFSQKLYGLPVQVDARIVPRTTLWDAEVSVEVHAPSVSANSTQDGDGAVLPASNICLLMLCAVRSKSKRDAMKAALLPVLREQLAAGAYGDSVWRRPAFSLSADDSSYRKLSVRVVPLCR